MKINKVFITALVISILIHIAIFAGLSVFDKKEKKQQEEKPIYISLINTEKKHSKKGVSKRKIPKKTKVKTPSKTTKPKNVKLNKKSISKEKKSKKSKKTTFKNLRKKQTTKKKNIEKTYKIAKKEVQKTEKKENKIKPIKEKVKKEIPISAKEGKNLQISQGNKSKKNKNLPKLPVPPAENKKAKEEKPPKQLNISHLKGKDQIFQMGEEKPEKEGTPEKDEDVVKYLYYVRDILQENLAYPLTAKRLEIEGTVIIRFVIDKNGNVNLKNIKIVKSSGSNILDKQAIITVENSVPFKPPPNKKSIVVEIPVIFEIIRSYN